VTVGTESKYSSKTQENKQYLELFKSHGKITLGPKNYFIKLSGNIPNSDFVKLYDLALSLGGSFAQQGEYGAFEIPITTTIKKELKQLWLTDLVASPAPIRRKQPDIDTLIKNMSERGQLLPIVVTPSKNQRGKFVVIDGNLRWRAAIVLNWTKIDAIIEDDISYSELVEETLLLNWFPGNLEKNGADSLFDLMAKFLTAQERRKLLDIFMTIQGDGKEITSSTIKNASKDIKVHRTALLKAYTDQKRGLSDETAKSILEYLFSKATKVEGSIEKDQINDLITQMYLRLESAHNMMGFYFFYLSRANL
jgi:hypothetical protein